MRPLTVDVLEDRRLLSFQGVAPLGSLIEQSTSTGAIAATGATQSSTVLLDPGQKVTLVVSPAAALCPTVRLFRVDSGGPVLVGTATAAAPGREAVLQTVATAGQLGLTAPGPKSYMISVNGVANTTGGYSLQTLLNAAVENESHGGPANDTRAAAQSLEPSFLPLNSAVTLVQTAAYPGRGAVLGRSDAAGPDYYVA